MLDKRIIESANRWMNESESSVHNHSWDADDITWMLKEIDDQIKAYHKGNIDYNRTLRKYKYLLKHESDPKNIKKIKNRITTLEKNLVTFENATNTLKNIDVNKLKSLMSDADSGQLSDNDNEFIKSINDILRIWHSS